MTLSGAKLSAYTPSLLPRCFPLVWWLPWGSAPVLSGSFCHTVSAAFVSQEAQLCETLLGVNPLITWSWFSRLSLVPVLHLSLSAAGLQHPAGRCGLAQEKQAVSFCFYIKFILKRRISNFVFWHYNKAVFAIHYRYICIVTLFSPLSWVMGYFFHKLRKHRIDYAPNNARNYFLMY